MQGDGDWGVQRVWRGKETDIPEAKGVRRTHKVIKIHPEKGPRDSRGGLCRGNYQRLRTGQDDGAGRG